MGKQKAPVRFAANRYAASNNPEEELISAGLARSSAKIRSTA